MLKKRLIGMNDGLFYGYFTFGAYDVFVCDITKAAVLP